MCIKIPKTVKTREGEARIKLKRQPDDGASEKSRGVNNLGFFHNLNCYGVSLNLSLG
ncbi:MAG: hypothetical protein QXG76_01815 [Candidatus Bathyarchaeia archaeon]